MLSRARKSLQIPIIPCFKYRRKFLNMFEVNTVPFRISAVWIKIITINFYNKIVEMKNISYRLENQNGGVLELHEKPWLVKILLKLNKKIKFMKMFKGYVMMWSIQLMFEIDKCMCYDLIMLK